MKTIAVIGAGQMGSGISQVTAQAGYNVLLSDVSLEIAQKAISDLEKRLGKLVARDRLDAGEARATIERITAVANYEPMVEADLIVEAATEREAIKLKIFQEVGKYLRSDAILASNTSSIPITRMANTSPDPKRFIGIHYFNPVPVMGLIEVIPGLATSPETVETVTAYCETLHKKVVFSDDSPGFVVNRILLPMINEAIFSLGQGIANIIDIDAGCRLGLNHPMGPLELADFVGLDTCLDIINVLHATTGDPKFRPAPLLVKYVEAGWIGRKVGRGFYDYSTDTPVPTR